MKNIILLIAVLSSFLLAQAESNNWGKRIAFANEFVNTDSVKIKTSAINDTVTSTDTLYSAILHQGEHSEGVFGSSLWLNSTSGGSESIKVDVRLVYVFTESTSGFFTTNKTTVKFGDWNSVFSGATEKVAVSDTSFSNSNSSWWQPASGRQYRVYDTVASNSTIVYLNDYSR